MAQRCLACHKEVAWLIDRGRGLHAKSRTASTRPCAACHPDHAGEDFALIDWGPGGSAGFDHARAGWALEGKHARAKCTACHDVKFRKSAAAALSPRRGTAGWMGLETSCISCHARDDVHRETLGASCERCHDAVDWTKPVRFDHDKSKYPLTGKHADVACDRCHKAARLRLRAEPDGRIIGRYKPLPAAECSACHANPHRDRVSAKCSTCHTTRDFKEVNRREFNHGATRYALTGRHAAVACEGCHGVGLTHRTPAFARCDNCHKDAHYGRATLKNQPADCAACHQVEGFAPSTYTAEQHRAAPYALAGRHQTVACVKCHVAADSVVRVAPRQVRRWVQLRPAATTCESCHENPHRGDRALKERDARCVACHDERGWAPSAFTAARHAALGWPLDGSHAPLSCARCHVRRMAPATPPAAAGRVTSAQVALQLDGGCGACHLDPHDGRYSPGVATAPARGCVACHDARRFAPATLAVASHTEFGFALDGAHRAVPCRDCHRELRGTPSPRTLRTLSDARVVRLAFAETRRGTCASCHADIHGGQFAARPHAGGCDGCHTTAQWAGAARFVHDRDTSFPLAGAHSRVPCAACHPAAAQSGGGTRVQYRPRPTACEGCHAAAALRNRS